MYIILDVHIDLNRHSVYTLQALSVIINTHTLE